MWTIPYLLHAYGVKRSNFQNKRKADKKGATSLDYRKVEYSTWIHAMFDTLGWMYEPQAPQGLL